MADTTKQPSSDNNNNNNNQRAQKANVEPVNEAKDAALNVVGQTKDLIGSQASQRQEKSAADLKDVAEALRTTSSELEGNIVSPYIQRAAEQIDRASEYLRTANLRDVQTTVESFARREPLLFLGGAFALGLLGARFLKSSASQMDHDGVGHPGAQKRSTQNPSLSGR